MAGSVHGEIGDNYIYWLPQDDAGELNVISWVHGVDFFQAAQALDGGRLPVNTSNFVNTGFFAGALNGD